MLLINTRIAQILFFMLNTQSIVMKQKYKPTFHLFFALIGGFLLIAPAACTQPPSQLKGSLDGEEESSMNKVDEEHDTEEKRVQESYSYLRCLRRVLSHQKLLSNKGEKLTLLWTREIAENGSEAMRVNVYKIWLEYDFVIMKSHSNSDKLDKLKKLITAAKNTLNLSTKEKRQAHKNLRIYF